MGSVMGSCYLTSCSVQQAISGFCIMHWVPDLKWLALEMVTLYFLCYLIYNTALFYVAWSFLIIASHVGVVLSFTYIVWIVQSYMLRHIIIRDWVQLLPKLSLGWALSHHKQEGSCIYVKQCEILKCHYWNTVLGLYCNAQSCLYLVSQSVMC